MKLWDGSKNKNQGFLAFCLDQGLLRNPQHRSETYWCLHGPRRESWGSKRLFKFCDCWRTSSHMTGCCSPCQPEEARAQLSGLLLSFGSRQSAGRRASCSEQSEPRRGNLAQDAGLCLSTSSPGWRLRSFHLSFLLNHSNHEQQVTFTNGSDILCLKQAKVWGTWLVSWQNFSWLGYSKA